MKDVLALEGIPNVGEATARDLRRVGVNSVTDLVDADAIHLFDKLCELDGVQHDPCTLDIFFSAVDYATNGAIKPWWKYTELRKKLYGP